MKVQPIIEKIISQKVADQEEKFTCLAEKLDDLRQQGFEL